MKKLSINKNQQPISRLIFIKQRKKCVTRYLTHQTNLLQQLH
jgi:hypothetical protein